MNMTLTRLISCVLVVVFVCACVGPVQAVALNEPVDILSTDGWELVEENTYTISSQNADTAEDIAGFICEYLAFYGVSTIIRYIGRTYLTDMIEDSVNGTLNVKMYWSYITGQPIQYMYVWTFKAANSTETKGPFRYVQTNQYTSFEDDLSEK